MASCLDTQLSPLLLLTKLLGDENNKCMCPSVTFIHTVAVQNIFSQVDHKYVDVQYVQFSIT